MSERKPQLKELSLALKDLTWSEIEAMAVQLDMPYRKLKQIKQENNEVIGYLHSTMHIWLNSDKEASWAKIVTALHSIDKNVLAENLEKQYCQPLNNTPDITAALSETATNFPPSCSNAPSPPSSSHLSFSDSLQSHASPLSISHSTEVIPLDTDRDFKDIVRNL